MREVLARKCCASATPFYKALSLYFLNEQNTRDKAPSFVELTYIKFECTNCSYKKSRLSLLFKTCVKF